MSRTTDMIEHYLLEFDVSPDMTEYYGDVMRMAQLESLHQVVCIDSNCTRFKDVDQVAVGDIIHVEDEHGDMNSYKIVS